MKRVVLSMLVACSASVVTAADALCGDWKTADGTAHVRIEPASDGKTDEGSLVWLESPNDDSGTPRHDDHNPEASLRSRPILGLKIITGLTPDGDRTWKGGSIYDPKSGKTYRCKAELSSDGASLELRGYIGVSLLGRSESWTRVPASQAGTSAVGAGSGHDPTTTRPDGGR
jgi:uncharacterized protein (DUF2147 family)